jgi:hypothetical protein
MYTKKKFSSWSISEACVTPFSITPFKPVCFPNNETIRARTTECFQSLSETLNAFTIEKKIVQKCMRMMG